MRFRFRLRTLAIVLTALCVVLAPFASWLQRVNVQSRAVRYLEASGARIFYDYQVANIGGRHACDEEREPPNNWLMRFVGINAACDVAGVWCPRYRDETGKVTNELADADMPVLRSLKGLRFVLIDSQSVSDDGTSVFQALRGLEDIGINSARITDRTLDALKGHKSLTALSLNGTKVTDRGVLVIGTLTQLKVLDLGYTGITGESMETLAKLEGLVELHIRGTDIGPRRLHAIQNLRNLQVLDVRECGVSDADAAELAEHLPNVAIYHESD